MRHRCLAPETSALKAPVRGSAKGEDKDRPVSYLTSQEYPSRRGGPGVCRGHSGEAAFWCTDDTACAGAGAPTHHSRGSRNTTHDDITPGAPWRRKRRDRIADAPALTSQPPTSRVSPDTGVGSHAASQALVDQDQADPHAVGGAHRPQARGRLTGGSGAGHRGAERDPGGLTGASTRLALPAHAPPVRGRRGEGARCLSAGVESMERPFNGSGGRRSPTAKCSLGQSLSAARRRVGDRLPAC